MRFGLCTDIRNILAVEKAGFDYLDGKLNQFALWSDEDFHAAVKLVRSSGIKMERCSLLFPKTMMVIGPQHDHDEMVIYLENAFSRMEALDCDLVAFGSGKSRNIHNGMNWVQSYRELVSVTMIIGEIAAKHGIRVAVEPLNRAETNFINSLAEGCALVSDVDLPNVGLMADSYHMWQENEDFRRLLTCGPFMHTHIAMKGSRSYPLEGTEELRTFFDLLRKAGYDGTMSIEGKSDDWETDSVQALEVLRGM